MSKKIIFIIEDDPDISELMKLIIENAGYVVKTFSQSVNMETRITTHKPTLVLADLWVGGTDNAKMIGSLKKKKATAGTPIVIVSAKNSLDKIAKKCGADGFLAKPFDIEALMEIVRKFTA